MMRTQYGVNVRVINNSWGGGDYSARPGQRHPRRRRRRHPLRRRRRKQRHQQRRQPPVSGQLHGPERDLRRGRRSERPNLASFSCYGATTVDIAAPGVSIYSTVPGNRYAIYSGTSMATPFVSGVAALAWAVDPNATVAEVRNAILDGADRVAALSGKVASRRRPQRLSHPATARRSIAAGTGRSDRWWPRRAPSPSAPPSRSAPAESPIPSGTVTSVSFYPRRQQQRTIRRDGYRCSDRRRRSPAARRRSRSAAAAGRRDRIAFFARAQDSAGVWSSCASTTLTVLPADDYGNSAATAAAVGVPSSTAGTIETGGDVDWFKFQAVAGKSYVFTVKLGTLPDSVLYLYDTNGAKQLAFNDDYGSGNASQIAWTAPATGVYYLAVAGYGSSDVGTYTLSVARSKRRSGARPHRQPDAAVFRRRRSPSPCTPPTPTATA